MKFILIAVFLTYDTSLGVEFNTIEACEMAMESIKKNIKRPVNIAYIDCHLKGVKSYGAYRD